MAILYISRHIVTCFKSSFVQITKRNSSSHDVIYGLLRRGLAKQLFPPEQSINCPKTSSAYAGFDPTADSLHVGNLLILVALLHWQRAGHKTIALIGDVTAQVGDPSGHKSDRARLSKEVVEKNCESIEKKLIEIFDNHERFIYPKAKTKNKLGELCILRNSEWYDKIGILDFFLQCRPIRHGDMVSRTSVKTRTESETGIDFCEFSYQVFQSYDWLHLLKEYDCRFQFGGNDQLGNITTGHWLISKALYQQVYGILLPLIQSETGDKFGKSAGNAVYLSSHRTSPFDLYQFFMRLPDADIPNFLKYFTFLSTEEIEDIVHHHLKNPDIRKGQQRLAEEVTLLVHGEEGLNFAKNATLILYQSDLTALAQLKAEQVNQVFPQSSVSRILFEPGTSIFDLTMKIGCFINKNDAHRIIREGGVYLNFQRITSSEYIIVPDLHILPNGITLIRIGKKTYYVVTWK